MQQESFETSCAFLLHEVARLLRKRFDARVADLGFTQSTWRVIGLLSRVGDLRQSQLGELLAIEKAPTGVTLDRLQAGGWIARRIDPCDRRARLVGLTEKSIPVIKLLQRRFHDLESEYLASLSKLQRQNMMASLLKVRDTLVDATGSMGPELQSSQNSELWLLLDCTRRMSRLFVARLTEIGFTRTQWLVLSTVMKRQGVRQIDMAATLEMSPALLGRVIDQLEAEAWLERRVDGDDRRANLVFLGTAKTRDLIAIRGLFDHLQEHIVSALSVNQRRQLSRSLQHVHGQLLQGCNR